MKKLTAKQIEALQIVAECNDKGDACPNNYYRLCIGRGYGLKSCLNAMERRNPPLVQYGNETRALGWFITDAGRAALVRR